MRRLFLLLGALLTVAMFVFTVPSTSKAAGTFWLQNGGNHLCLDAGPQPTPGSKPFLSLCDPNSPSQQWTFPANNYGGNSIQNIASGLCLDHANQKHVSGFTPYLYTCYNGEGQAWNNYVNQDGSAFLLPKDANETHVLDGYNNGQIGTNPYLFTSNLSNPYQHWFFVVFK